MYEFTIDGSLEDMDEADLRSTLDEFMDKHAENVEAYSELEAERDEFSEKIEGLESDVAEYSDTQDTLTEKFAEIVAEGSPLFSADEVAERFSLAELLEKADGMGLFSLPDGDTETEADEEAEESKFSEKPDKAEIDSESRSKFSADAEADVKAALGL